MHILVVTINLKMCGSLLIIVIQYTNNGKNVTDGHRFFL